MGAVLVADDRRERHLADLTGPPGVVGLGQLGVEAFGTRCATLDMCTTQVGVAMTRMSAGDDFSRMAGHSSPGPTSASTTGRRLWSTQRTDAHSTPALRIGSRSWSAITALLDGAGLGSRPHVRTRARRGLFFSSPSAEEAASVARAAHGDTGVLLITGNYAGDVMNIGLAVTALRGEGVDAHYFAVTDDIAGAPKGEEAKWRGTAGDHRVHSNARQPPRRRVSTLPA